MILQIHSLLMLILLQMVVILNSISKLENYLKEDENLELNLMIISIYNLITPEPWNYFTI